MWLVVVRVKSRFNPIIKQIQICPSMKRFIYYMTLSKIRNVYLK